jgi:hypothetical protein
VFNLLYEDMKGTVMKQVLKWVAIVLGVFLLVAIVASPFFFFRGYAPMMGGYRDGRGLRMMWFGGVWAMMLGRVLFPLLIIGLLVWGGYALGRGASRGNNSQRQVAASATPAAAPSVIEAPISAGTAYSNPDRSISALTAARKCRKAGSLAHTAVRNYSVLAV